MSDRTLGAGESSISDETEMALEATVSSRPQASGGRPTKRGSLVDRYVVLDLAGAGAMGMVLAAYDPELDRKVAVKLLKVSGAAAHTRLQREAQALAKLDHRNVVGVYDVGTHDGQLFMAMEFVEGKTLGKWMAELGHPRPWPEVVRVLSEAGRGLAAAHAAGLVHRDFKPENVMMGADGRVRVMDFGLARTTSLSERDADFEPSALSGSHHALEQNVTRTGALMGTPAYMSPEQFAGKPADARSDQFGFCISLYEALYGERPFLDGSLAELIESLDDCRLKPPPAGVSVPAWVRKIVVRGLAPAPEDRWPSMDALLDALADDPRARRRKWLAGSLAVALLGALTTAGILAARTDDPTCQGLGDRLDGVWDETRRAEVEAAMLATGLSYAPGTWARLEPLLDAYARAWVDARTQACQATARGEQSSELLDLRMACLDRHRTQLRTTIDVLAHADAAAVENAAAVVDRLPSLAACSDREALLHGRSPNRDPQLAAAVEQLEHRRIEAETLASLGQPQRALEQIEAVVGEAEALGDEPTRVHVGLSLGRLQYAAGNFQGAEDTLRAGYRAALLASMPAQAAAAARELVNVVGSGTGLVHLADGRAWAFHAEALTSATGSREDYADYLMGAGGLAKMADDYAAAREHFEQALAIYDSLRPDHYRVVSAITNLANVESFAGNVEQARAHYLRGLSILQQTRDPTHPDIGRLYLSLGELDSQAGHWAEARANLDSAVAVFEQALGPDHPLLGYAIGSLGYVIGWQGDYPLARAKLERSVQILETAVGREHFHYADAVGRLGAIEFLAGDYAAAGEHYELARASLVRQMGPDHTSVGIALINLGELALHEDHFELALEHSDAALAILEPKFGAEHLDLVLALETRGRALLALGRAAEAIEPLERALAIHVREHAGEADLALLRFALAQALADGGGDRSRATELAELARDHSSDAELRERIDAWLRE